ncbi:MAG TPA: ribosome biogenesis GTPase Der, partial [Dehalococcoidia bacterium]|nr:ribosome biogenesis GTPase Der [Dehalococcoidia bacterium]
MMLEELEPKTTTVAKPIVAIVGRPNVGKSALFNRMIGERRAIVEDIAGTTRDRLQGEVEWRGRSFDLIDTGGLAEPTSVAGSGAYMDAIRDQVHAAIRDADLLLFVVDVKSGSTSADREVAEMLRRAGKPTLLVANKADNNRRGDDALEFYEFGLGEPQAVSAINSAGVGELLDTISDMLPELPETEVTKTAAGLRVAIIGRPNVGKSALVNAILGEERVIVSDIAGTTRDAIDTPFDYEGNRMTLIDTAGIRRPGRVEGSIEHYSVMRSKGALERADVAVAVFDASERIHAQDLHIIGMALDESTGLVVCANKWDLIYDKLDRPSFLTSVRRRLRFATWVPVVTTSAQQGIGLDELLREVNAAGEERKRRVQTSELNAIMRGAIARRPPPPQGRRRLKLLYVTQVRTEPPTFVFFVNHSELINSAYKRYLENNLRRAFGFRGAGLRL